MNVLVTGGTGLIGRKLVPMLCDRGDDVTVISMDDLELDDRANYQLADLSNFSECKLWTMGMDTVFHLAGVKGSPKVTKEKPASFFVPTLMMNTNILEACRLNGVKKVVYTSTIGAYAAPSKDGLLRSTKALEGIPMDGAPGWAKRMGELQIKYYYEQYGLDSFTILRLCNVYGEGDNFDPDNAMVIPSLMAKIARGDDPVEVWGDGTEAREFAYSEDVANVILDASTVTVTQAAITNVGGLACPIDKLVDELHSIADFRHRFTGGEAAIKRKIMYPGFFDLYKATPLEEGLKKTWDWYLQNKDEHLKKQNYFREEK